MQRSRRQQEKRDEPRLWRVESKQRFCVHGVPHTDHAEQRLRRESSSAKIITAGNLKPGMIHLPCVYPLPPLWHLMEEYEQALQRGWVDCLVGVPCGVRVQELLARLVSYLVARKTNASSFQTWPQPSKITSSLCTQYTICALSLASLSLV